MAYYLSLCSPETYEAFSGTDMSVTGTRERHQNAATRVQVGDKFLYYMTKLGRWCGVATVATTWFRDDSPRYQDATDPFVIRFRISNLTWLPKEKSIPIHDERVWTKLSFTSGYDPKSNRWTGKIRTSLTKIEDADGQYLEHLILTQAAGNETFPYDHGAYEKLFLPKVHSPEGVVSVSVPVASENEEALAETPQAEARESIKIQAQLPALALKWGCRFGFLEMIERLCFGNGPRESLTA